MVKRKGSPRPRQVQQVPNSKSTNNDIHKRLATPNGQRRSTDHGSVPLGGIIATPIHAMSQMLDRRIRFRLPIVLAGAMLAGARRTAPTGSAAPECSMTGIDFMICFGPSERTQH
jgi:hypothetical protein